LLAVELVSEDPSPHPARSDVEEKASSVAGRAAFRPRP
jgi:hypothetical protein